MAASTRPLAQGASGGRQEVADGRDTQVVGVICDDRGVAKAGCGRSYAPFPPGCMFHSEGGLKSFEHPMNRLKAFPRVDSEGVMCGANFKVDAFTKINSMPRVGSATNWAATWDDAAI